MFKIKNRIWIEGKNGTFLAEGRIVLLEQIIEKGSISAAAKGMSMSYKKAWEMIHAINSESNNPIVIKKTGGKNGGGAVVTKEGILYIDKFKKLKKKCDSFLNKELKEINIQFA